MLTLTDADELLPEALERIRQCRLFDHRRRRAALHRLDGRADPRRNRHGHRLAMFHRPQDADPERAQRRETLLEHLLHAAHLASMDLGWRPEPV